MKSAPPCALLLLLLASTARAQDKEYAIKEQSGRGAYVGNIPQDLELPYVPADRPPRTYQVINGDQRVSVDPVSGDLKTAADLDREQLCPDNPPSCAIDVEVMVSPDEYFRFIKVRIVVEDLNDNAPDFPTHVIEKDISESAAVGAAIRLDSAVDPDLGANSIARYELGEQSDPAHFRLVPIPNVDGTIIPQLTLTRALDREDTDRYELVLYSVDGGAPALTGTATVSITVTDSNDNQPRFGRDKYEVRLKESTPVGSEVIRLVATDDDAGDNADIVYRFPSIVGVAARERFAIDENTGSITIKRQLDYEMKRIYHLTVEARDSGPNPASAYATVTVNVTDVNDEAPRIDVNFISVEKRGANRVRLREDVAVGTSIAFVTITDRDSGINGNASCRLEAPSSFKLHEITKDDNRYLLRTAEELDRETKRTHQIKIVAWDTGPPSLQNHTTLTVELADVNDNAPHFAKDLYSVYVREDVSPGDQVTLLGADDKDDGVNAQLTYRSEPASAPFRVVADTGQVVFDPGADGVALDAENRTAPYLLTVTATDHGESPMSASTTLQITVSDVNDNAPRFGKDNYRFRIAEDARRGHHVGAVAATDADVDRNTNARITYTFLNRDQSPFSIKQDTGEVYFDGRPEDLDREARSSQPYSLTVQAEDHGQPSRSSLAYVEVYLVDVNDNSPRVVFPNVTRDVAVVYVQPEATSNATAHVRVGTARRADRATSLPAVVTRVRAKDDDEGENGRVTFMMASGAGAEQRASFRVERAGGNVTMLAPDGSAPKRGCHVIVVTVADLGSPTGRKTTAWVNVYVTDKRVGEVNKTQALNECRQHPSYPVLTEQTPGGVTEAGTSHLVIIIIVCFCSVLLILAVIMVLMLVKYRCSCTSERVKGRTYNCKQADDAYDDRSFVKPSEASYGEHRFRGTSPVDNRTSYCSEWTQSQIQLANHQEKAATGGSGGMMMMTRRAPSVDSVASHNTARDSGTGDSMPSDAAHGYGANGKVPASAAGYAKRQMNNYQPHQPSHVYLPPNGHPLGDDQLDGSMTKGFPPYHGTSSAGSTMVYTSKCTPDCRRFGHSDTCWMPDSLQRAPSRMSSFKAAAAGEDPAPGGSLYHVNQVGEVGSYLDPRRGTTPEPGEHKMRYTSAPSCNTPYYYDPVSNFESTPPSQHRRPNNYPQTGPPHFTSFHRDPNYATGTFPYPGGGGAYKQAYVNMQTDGGGSALSYNGGGEPPYQNYEPHHILPHPHHQQQHAVQQYPIMTSYQQPYHTYEDVAYDQAYRAAPYSAGSAAPYDDEFPPAPNMSGDDYKQRSTPTTYYQQQQQQQQNYSDDGEQERLLPDNNDSENKDPAASVDKLSTIREEIDADEVIAGIDGLLL